MVLILFIPICSLLIFTGILFEWGKDVKLKLIYRLLFGLLVPYIIAVPALLLGRTNVEGIVNDFFYLFILIGLFVSVPGLIVLGVRMFFLKSYREKVIGVSCMAFATFVLIMAYVVVTDPGFI